MSVDREAREAYRMVSIVIPTYNEASYIEETILAVADAFRAVARDVEILVVDDGSTDDTVIRSQRLASTLSTEVIVLAHTHNRGKGAALQTGFLHSRGTLVGFIDADREYPVQALPAMALMIDDSPQPMCVVGRRVADDRTWLERTTSRLAHRAASAVLHLPVDDTQAGIKMFPGPILRAIAADCHQSGWLYDLELLIRVVEQQLSIVELPVRQRSVRGRRASLWSMVRCGPILVDLAIAHRQRTRKNIRRKFDQVARFGVVGAINSVVDLGAFWLLTQWFPVGHRGVEAGAESLVAWMIASVVGYTLHSRFTFRRQLSRVGFYGVTGIGVGIQVLLTALAAQALGPSEALLGKMVGIALASCVTYFGYGFLARKSQIGIPTVHMPLTVRAEASPEVCHDPWHELPNDRTLQRNVSS